jgi:hypothetical protein
MKGNKAKPKKANYNADAIEILKQKYGVQYVQIPVKLTTQFRFKVTT